MQPLSKIKQVLLKKQQKVEAEIKALDEEDPVLSDQTPESSEPGTDSWLADVHSRSQAAKLSLMEMLKSTKKALARLNTGKYGKCEKCGKQIEEKRLEVMPDATRCISCSKLK